MRSIAKAALGVLILTGATLATTAPALAYPGISFGFGGPEYRFADPCDYYDYYAEPPPWGLPPSYCDYPIYSDPVFVGGTWYRGPIFYRWTHGRRLFWLNGGWRSDEWRGAARPPITWQDRGGWNHGFRPGMNLMRPGPRPWIGGRPMGGGHFGPGFRQR